MTFAYTPDVIETESEDGLVLLNQRTGQYWQVNGTAAQVLRLLLGGGGIDGAVRELGERHPQHTARLGALTAVAVARPLARLSPRRLRQTLRLLARGARPATAAHALAARQAVVSVSRRCAGPRCLQRSIATALLCRARGNWPDWCTGVRTEPFLAHAWVEVGGQAVGEAQDMGLYRRVMTVRAGRSAG